MRDEDEADRNQLKREREQLEREREQFKREREEFNRSLGNGPAYRAPNFTTPSFPVVSPFSDEKCAVRQNEKYSGFQDDSFRNQLGAREDSMPESEFSPSYAHRSPRYLERNGLLGPRDDIPQ